jgi:hypothetical protein
MRHLRFGVSALALTTLTAFAVLITNLPGQDTRDDLPATIPRTWDDRAMATLEVPLARADASPVPVSADYYYRIPVRPTYKTYPVYHPDQEPSGYFERLESLEPDVISFDFSNFKTTDERSQPMKPFSPTDYDISGSPAQFRDATYYTVLDMPVAAGCAMITCPPDSGATATRAVRGHEFGLMLSGENKAASIAFLKTLYEPFRPFEDMCPWNAGRR